MTREKEIEKKLKVEVEKKGGLCIKWTAPNMRGLPDRIVISNLGRIYFVELKAPGKHNNLSPIQKSMHAKLKERNCDVRVISTYDQVNDFIKEIFHGI